MDFVIILLIALVVAVLIGSGPVLARRRQRSGSVLVATDTANNLGSRP